MKKKVILATAPEYFVEMWYSAPLGLAYIAACLEKAGYGVEIVDSHLNRYSMNKAAKVIVDKKPDAVGLTATTDNRFKAIELSKRIKELNPDIFLFVGGPHFSVTAEDALRNVTSIDAVVRGEGEITAVELLNSYFSKKPLYNVRGISFRDSPDNGRIITTQKRPVFEKLDSLPMPAYHLLNLKRYSPLPSYFTSLTREEKMLPAAGVISSRGCPYNCIFCANNSEFVKTFFRKRDPVRFVDEIQYINRTHGIKMFNFWDDTFTLSKQYVLDVCNEIIKRSLGIKWYARGRVDTLDREALIKMKEAGCVAMLYGVESGCDRILKIIKKGITVEQVKKVVKNTVETGIDVLLAFMVSFPGETRDDVEKTLGLIKELLSYDERVFETDLSPTVIYPGTVIEKIALSEKRIIPEDFSWNKRYEFRKNRQLLIVPSLPIYAQKFTLEEIMAFRLRNKYQQRLKQSKTRLFSKAIRFIAGIRTAEDLKTLFFIVNSLLFRKGAKQ